MIAAFTIAFPLGAVWARFRPKGNPDRIPRHKQLQFLGGVIALVAAVLAFVVAATNGASYDGTMHPGTAAAHP